MAKNTEEQVVPDPWEIIAKMSAIMEKMVEKNQGDPNQQEVLGLALARLADAQIEGAKLNADASRAAHRPSNEVIPGMSVFNRRGNQLREGAEGPRKLPLKCIMLIPWLVEWESCTREEVELLNLLQEGEYVVKRIDNSRVRVEVQIQYKEDNITPTHLIMRHDTAFKNDNFRLMPPLATMLRDILRQHDREIAIAAQEVMTDDDEAGLIEHGQLEVSP